MCVCNTLENIVSFKETQFYFVGKIMTRNYIIILMFHVLLVLSSIVGFNSTTENGDMKCKERERHALLTFKQDLEDEYDMLSTWNNNQNTDCCKWKGVRCNKQTGYVQSLDLHGLENMLFGW